MIGTDEQRVLICSDRVEVRDRVARAFERLPARPRIAAGPDEWPEASPSLVVVDLADASQPVREACLAFSDRAAAWALVDGDSSRRLLPALAAGCADYLFYPINPAELELRWRKHLEAGRHVEARLREIAGRLELTVPSSVAFLQPTVGEVVAACERLAVGGSRARLNLQVALGEALANAILYGSGEDPNRSVRVAAEFGETEVRVTVEDEGEGFDPEAVADPTEPGNRDEPHGRGLFLIRSLMDEVSFNERGNAVTLVLRFDG